MTLQPSSGLRRWGPGTGTDTYTGTCNCTYTSDCKLILTDACERTYIRAYNYRNAVRPTIFIIRCWLPGFN